MRSLTFVVSVALVLAAAASAVPTSGSTSGSGSKPDNEDTSSASSVEIGSNSLESSVSGATTAAPRTSAPGGTSSPGNAISAMCKRQFFNADPEATGSDFTDLSDFAVLGPVTLNLWGSNDTVILSPCTPVALQPNCTTGGPKNPAGFAAIIPNGQMEGSSVCAMTTYTSLTAAVKWNTVNNNYFFSSEVTSGSGEGMKTLNIDYQCDTNGGTNASMVNGALVVYSFKLCPEKMQAVVPIPAGSCSVEFSKFGRNYKASLADFSKGTRTINGMPAQISPCGAMIDFTTSSDLIGCKGSGFMAYMDGAACVVLNEKVSSYNPNDLAFNTTYFTTATEAPVTTAAPALFEATATSTRIVIVECGATDSTDGVVSGNTITYTSTEACGEEAPATSAAPKPEDDGLSAGVIVAIVIGAIVVVVLLLLVAKFLCFGGDKEEEGEYNRV